MIIFFHLDSELFLILLIIILDFDGLNHLHDVMLLFLLHVSLILKMPEALICHKGVLSVLPLHHSTL
jgi:hypothetical protein